MCLGFDPGTTGLQAKIESTELQRPPFNIFCYWNNLQTIAGNKKLFQLPDFTQKNLRPTPSSASTTPTSTATRSSARGERSPEIRTTSQRTVRWILSTSLLHTIPLHWTAFQWIVWFNELCLSLTCAFHWINCAWIWPVRLVTCMCVSLSCGFHWVVRFTERQMNKVLLPKLVKL